MHKILLIRLYFSLMFYMFRTILVHHQEQLYELYIAFGICRYHTSGHATATRMVPAYTKCDVQLIKIAPEDGLI